MLVQLGMLEDVFILEEGAYLLNDGRGKVGVARVNSVDSYHDVADLFQGVAGGELLGLEQIIFGNVEIGSDMARQVSVVVFLVRKGLLLRRRELNLSALLLTLFFFPLQTIMAQTSHLSVVIDREPRKLRMASGSTYDVGFCL